MVLEVLISALESPKVFRDSKKFFFIDPNLKNRKLHRILYRLGPSKLTSLFDFLPAATFLADHELS